MKPFLHRSTLFSAVCAVAGLSALTATAQTDPVPPAPATPSIDAHPTDPAPTPPGGYIENTGATLAPDRDAEQLISKISMLHSEEIRLAQVAAQRASSDQVRTFAEQVRAAAQTAEQELDQLARTKNVTIPTGKNADDLADEENKWAKKDAKGFDEDFVERIVKISKDAIDTLEGYSKDNDSDPELAAFAQKHLPTARENLRQAESLEKQVD